MLPGGGDLRLRLWAGIRRWTQALATWYREGRKDIQDFQRHVKMVQDFSQKTEEYDSLAWDLLENTESLNNEVGIVLFLLDMQEGKAIDPTVLFKLVHLASGGPEARPRYLRGTMLDRKPG